MVYYIIDVVSGRMLNSLMEPVPLSSALVMAKHLTVPQYQHIC